MSEIYHEISARQTGKTVRMVEAIVKDLHNGLQHAFILSRNMRTSEGIRKDVIERLNCNCCAEKIIAVQSMNPESDEFQRFFRGMSFKPSYRFYVDEYDFIDPRNLAYDESAYYVTTPKRIRKYDDNGIGSERDGNNINIYFDQEDFLFQLVKKHKPKRYMWYFSSVIERDNLPTSQTRMKTELMGEY